ncbi:hypothetical protein [Treponema sp. OMZ 805]|uniref:hypothetical protein n=1 Tax=Treponema sp. OMZ 805 TaxID=2726068 RepID=UPI003D90B76C
MKKGRLFPLLLTLLLLLVQTVFFQTGCTTTKAPTNADIDVVLQNIAPEKPPVPAMEPVLFKDKDGGLWLSYEAYRALERNIIAMREYAARLEVIIAFWEKKEK